MIKISDECVHIEGMMLDVILDLARAIAAVHKSAEATYDKEFSDEAVVLAGRIAEFTWGDPDDDAMKEMLPLHMNEFNRIAAECTERKKMNDK